MSDEKELFTRRLNKKLMGKVRRVKRKTGKNHTQFIEEAIDEKLLREGHARKSVFKYNKVNH